MTEGKSNTYASKNGSDHHLSTQSQAPASSVETGQSSPTPAESKIAETNSEETSFEEMKLEDQLTQGKLRQLEDIFRVADEDGGGGLDMDEFRIAMRKTMGENISDEELDMIFMKVDTNCDGTVDWDEYLTYMLLECREKDRLNVQSRQPFPRSMQPAPDVHRDSILRILFMSNTNDPEEAEENLNAIEDSKRYKEALFNKIHDGRYLSASKDGIICIWSLSMKPLYMFKIEPPSQVAQRPTKEATNNGSLAQLSDNRGRQATIWVTDVVYMPCDRILAVSSTARDISFFDLSTTGCKSRKFKRISRITGLPSCVMCLNYAKPPQKSSKELTSEVSHSSRGPTISTCSSMLVWGDADGGLNALYFQTEPHLCSSINPMVSSKEANDQCTRISWAELVIGHVPNLRVSRVEHVHSDITRQVLYSTTLGCFVSCSKDTTRSMYVGDLDRGMISYYFKVNKGINTFAYCRKLNVIVTGGYDAIVRVWNPWVPAKPIILLRGHQSAILHVLINPDKEYAISVAETKEIRVHDLNTQTCIQTFFRKMISHGGLGPRAISAALFNRYREALIVGTTSLALLENAVADPRRQRMTSHSCAITCALYNSLFHQIVSVDTDSMVCVWNFTSGEKVMQFSAHRVRRRGKTVDVEITAMSFDPTLRRLITAARDGSVKIWNFNNGACLRELPIHDQLEITSIVCPLHRIITAGWNRYLTLYTDQAEDNTVQLMRPKHRKDVLSLALYPPSIVASGSVDGDIVVWSLETGQLQNVFNAKHGTKTLTPVTRGGFVAPDKVGKVSLGEKTKSKTPNYSLSHAARTKQSNKKYAPKDNQQVMSKQLEEPEEMGVVDVVIDRKTRTEADEKEEKFKLRKTVVRFGDETEKAFEATQKTSRKCRYAVEKLLFLLTRPIDKKVATLLSGNADGSVRAWSIHPSGSMLAEFPAAHKVGGTVLTMVTDSTNHLLVTGDSHGYIKVWDIYYYYNPYVKSSKNEEEARINFHSTFTYVKWRKHLDKVHVRPDVSNSQKVSMTRLPPINKPTLITRHQDKVPFLLNSFRGHMRAVASLDLFTRSGQYFLLSASPDGSLRLWSIDGEFLGIFGQPELWSKKRFVTTRDSNDDDSTEVKSVSIGHGPRESLIPPDVKRCGSATTLRIFNGGLRPGWALTRHTFSWIGKLYKNFEEKKLDISEDRTSGSRQDLVKKDDHSTVEQKTVEQQLTDFNKGSTMEIDKSEILGKSYKKSKRHQRLPDIRTPRQFANQVIVYSSLPYADIAEVKEIKTPECVLDIQRRHAEILAAAATDVPTRSRSIEPRMSRAGKRIWGSAYFKVSVSSKFRSLSNAGGMENVIKKVRPPNLPKVGSKPRCYSFAKSRSQSLTRPHASALEIEKSKEKQSQTVPGFLPALIIEHL